MAPRRPPALRRVPRRRGTLRWQARDLLLLAVGLLAALAWDVSGADLAFSAWAGGARGFPLREHWLLARVLHDGGRVAAGTALALLAMTAAWRPARGPTRREHLGWLAVALLALLLVPLLKRASQTSCPWDLLPFGGAWPYVGHWQVGVADGGPGHCFPSGHAVTGWAFLATGFLWRPWRPRLAGALFAAVAVAGSAFALAQVLRGAHFVSHTLWSAWLCLAVAVTAEPWLRPRDGGLPPCRDEADDRPEGRPPNPGCIAGAMGADAADARPARGWRRIDRAQRHPIPEPASCDGSLQCRSER
ncbi:MAG: phosphatase PAP2 family protein [Rubrivivax sp.]|nr:phosphatase PAP2 family protein [Rubrivivax sp.]